MTTAHPRRNKKHLTIYTYKRYLQGNPSVRQHCHLFFSACLLFFDVNLLLTFHPLMPKSSTLKAAATIKLLLRYTAKTSYYTKKKVIMVRYPKSFRDKMRLKIIILGTMSLISSNGDWTVKTSRSRCSNDIEPWATRDRLRLLGVKKRDKLSYKKNISKDNEMSTMKGMRGFKCMTACIFLTAKDITLSGIFKKAREKTIDTNQFSVKIYKIIKQR